MNPQQIDIAEYIDHSLLTPTATLEELKQCCGQAEKYHFPTVCVYPTAVSMAVEILKNKKIKVCSVIGFPTGTSTKATKLYEALEAVEQGAQELDVVINLGWLKAGESDAIYQEIAAICEETGKSVKAILETNLLNDTEKRLAAEVCMDAGAAFLKTNTGWFGGVKVSDVELLYKITKGRVGIKAAGGIKTYEQALELIQAGASRLGTSRGPAIIQQQHESSL